VRAREEIVRRNEAITAMHSSRRERLDGREVERLFVHLPADPLLQGAANLHHADPEVLCTAPLPMAFHTRRYWFDTAAGLIVARQCGCKNTPDPAAAADPAIQVDYPGPEGLPADLFTFRIPARADVTVIDPELGRMLRSGGESERVGR
jgi:hypothetical protein